jgi:hypothetical protein
MGESRDCIGERARPPGLEVLAAGADPVHGVRAVDAVEQGLTPLDVLHDDVGTAVDAEGLRPAGRPRVHA